MLHLKRICTYALPDANSSKSCRPHDDDDDDDDFRSKRETFENNNKMSCLKE